MRASISVSSIRSGLVVPEGDIVNILMASWPLGWGGAVFRAVLEVDLIRLATLDLLETLVLLEALILLEILDLLKTLDLLIVLVVGILTTITSLVVIVINNKECD